MSYNIFRPLNKDELKDITPAGQADFLSMFLKELSAKKMEYQKLYRPFDYYCARMDFEENLKRKMEELQSAVDKKIVDTKLNFGDLDKYADVGRFDFIEKKITKETKLVAGIKQEVNLGYVYMFRAKTRGNRLNIFVPNEDLHVMDKFVEDNFTKKKKTDKGNKGNKGDVVKSNDEVDE